MSKDRKKVVHIHSNVYDKQPTPDTLELGELGVNNADGNAFISTKNSNNKVVRFSEDGTIVNWMEYKEVIPYEAYVRGSNTAATDVTTDDLANNKSNIVIKLNQVVARNTEYDEKVNGAKDIYGNEINPISEDGYKDGAGLAIDMSRYAMIGANPSFSSITTTCHTTLNGTTEIKGKGDSCGSRFSAEVANACIDASDTLNEYGANHSNFGTSCNGTNISNDTTLKGKKVLIESPSGDLTVDIKACSHISGSTNDFVIRECQDNEGKVEIDTTDINVSASTINAQSCDLVDIKSNNIVLEQCEGGNGQITIDTDDLCLVGNDKINVYGKETNVGIDCDENPQIAVNTNIVGNNVSITANDNGNNGITIGGNGTYPITYTRRVKDENCSITSTTVDDALDEVYNRSKISITQDGNTFTLYQDSGDCQTSVEFTIKETIVSMSADTPSTESPVAKTYTLWQTINGVDSEIGTIDIPKDHLLKDVSVVYGIWDESTFTPCTQTSEDCHWYIKMVYNVFDPSSGHPDDAIIYLPVDDFVKDINEDNTDSNRGVNVNVWYDGKQNLVSADTTIHFDTPNNDTNEFAYEKRDGEHWISGTTVAFNSGSFSATTYKPWSASTTVNIPTEVSHLERGTLSITHNGLTEEYDPSANSVWTLPHETLTINYGEAMSGGSVTYNTSSAASISIPTSVDHLDRGKLTYSHNGFSGEYDPASDGTFTSPHSALTIEYGATSGKSGSVTYNTSSAQTITIPTSVSGLTRGELTIKHNNENGETYDPASGKTLELTHNTLTVNYGGDVTTASTPVTYNTSSAQTITIPTSVSGLTREALKITINGDTANTVTYDATEEVDLNINTGGDHKALTINYGSTCGNDGTTVSYDTSSAQTITIPKTISDVTSGKIETDCSDSDSCIGINADICMSGHTIVAQSVYSTSDKRLKENIYDLVDEDTRNIDTIPLRRFNFINDETKTKIYGVLAQDVENAGYGNIVSKDENGYMSVDYTSFLILKLAKLESLVRKQQIEIDNLKKGKEE